MPKAAAPQPSQGRSAISPKAVPHWAIRVIANGLSPL
jgi:hypothetical protein